MARLKQYEKLSSLVSIARDFSVSYSISCGGQSIIALSFSRTTGSGALNGQWCGGRNESIFATATNSFCTKMKISLRKTFKQRRQRKRRDGQSWWWKIEHKQRSGICRRAFGDFTAPSPIALRIGFRHCPAQIHFLS